jgi:hypothetical protein
MVFQSWVPELVGLEKWYLNGMNNAINNNVNIRDGGEVNMKPLGFDSYP